TRGVDRREVPYVVGLRRRRRAFLHEGSAHRQPHALLGHGDRAFVGSHVLRVRQRAEVRCNRHRVPLDGAARIRALPEGDRAHLQAVGRGALPDRVLLGTAARRPLRRVRGSRSLRRRRPRVGAEPSVMDELAGKTAVVTGAASGIGLGLARRAASEGRNVVLADVEEDALAEAQREVRALDATTLALPTDVSNADAVDALAAKAFAEFGAAHLVFLNAGVFQAGVSWQRSEADWAWVLGVNLWG